MGTLNLMASFFELALGVLHHAGLHSRRFKLALGCPRLLLRFQNFAFGGERPLTGFRQLSLRVSDLILKFLKLFLGFARLVLRCLNLVMNVARQVLYFQNLILGLAGLPLGCLQFTPDFRDLLLGGGQINEVTFLFTPP